MDDEHTALLTDLFFCKFVHVSRRNALARAAGLYFFILEGICIGIWGLLLPTLQSNLQLADSELGAAAFFTYFGTIIGTVCASYLIGSLGMRRTALISSLGFSIALTMIVVFDSYAALLCFMLIFGICWGVVDVTANNATVLAEIVGGASYIGTCYGSFSLTAGCLSAVEEAITSNVISTLVTLTIITMVCNVAFAALIYDQTQESYILKFNREQQDHNRTRTVPEAEVYTPLEQDVYNCIISDRETSVDLSVAEEPQLRAQQEKSSRAQSTYSSLSMGEDEIHKNPTKSWSICRYISRLSVLRQSSAIYILGAVGFLGTFSEACMITWIVIYYKEVLHASTSKKAVGFGCLFVSMALGRFSCDFLRGRYGNKAVVFGSGLLVATGLWVIFALSFVPHSIALTSFGVALMGLGVSTLNPIAFSTAGHLAPSQNNNNPHLSGNVTSNNTTTSNGSAVATVAMCAYCGSIVSSPLVGLISDVSGSLRYGFLFVAIVASGIVPLSLHVPAK